MADDVKALVETSLSMLNEYQKALMEMYRTPRPRMSNLDWAMLPDRALKAYPPEPWISPQGVMVNASPWLIALQYAQGGKDVTRNIERVRTQGGY